MSSGSVAGEARPQIDPGEQVGEAVRRVPDLGGSDGRAHGFQITAM